MDRAQRIRTHRRSGRRLRGKRGANRGSWTPLGHPILRLQQVVGNRAVTHLLERPTGDSHSACPVVSNTYLDLTFARSQLRASCIEKPSSHIEVSKPGDPCEKDADTVAEQVASMPEADLAKNPVRSPESLSKLTTTPKTSAGAKAKLNHQVPGQSKIGSTPAIIKHRLGSDGSPLEGAVRQFMERRFGTSFDHVRIHTGRQAAAMAAELNAQAFTVGRDIVFNEGQFQPTTVAGRRLLAHELAHVAQQQSAFPVPRIMRQRLIAYSGNYDSYGGSLKREAVAIRAGGWLPQTVDFQATVSASGGGEPIGSFDSFLSFLERSGSSAHEIALIGHGYGAGGFAFAPGDRMSVSTIGAREARIRALKPLLKGKTFSFYACNMGTSIGFLDAVIRSFGVCARAFKEPLRWCVHIHEEPPGVFDVRSRGRVERESRVRGSSDCAADFKGNVFDLDIDELGCSPPLRKCKKLEGEPDIFSTPLRAEHLTLLSGFERTKAYEKGEVVVNKFVVREPGIIPTRYLLTIPLQVEKKKSDEADTITVKATESWACGELYFPKKRLMKLRL